MSFKGERRLKRMTSITKTAPAAKQRDEAGFTILETAIALVLMTIVGLGAASLFFYANSNTVSEGDRALAMAVAQQQVESLRYVDFNDVSLGATAGATSTVTRAGRNYTVLTTIEDSDFVNGLPTTKTIRIQVTPALGGPSVNTVFGSVTVVWQRAAVSLGPNRAL
jgi:type II secretory pathway pseudopilin PulG